MSGLALLLAGLFRPGGGAEAGRLVLGWGPTMALAAPATPSEPEPAAAPSGEPAPDHQSRLVVLVADETLSVPSLEQLRADLEAGLAPLGARVVLRAQEAALGPPRGVTARVTLRRAADARVTVEVDDYLTHKRLERDIDLSALPADGHALALALAADELLRASWAELALSQSAAQPREGTPPPPESASSDVPLASRPLFLLLGPTASTFSRGSTFLGAALSLGFRPRSFRFEAEFLALGALTRTVPEGGVGGQAWGGALSFGCDLLSSPVWSVGPVLGTSVLFARFEGTATGGNQGASLSGPWWTVRGGGFSSLESDRLIGTIELTGGYALSSVLAQADGRPVAGVSGFELAFSLQMGVKF